MWVEAYVGGSRSPRAAEEGCGTLASSRKNKWGGLCTEDAKTARKCLLLHAYKTGFSIIWKETRLEKGGNEDIKPKVG